MSGDEQYKLRERSGLSYSSSVFVWYGRGRQDLAADGQLLHEVCLLRYSLTMMTRL